MQRGRGAPTISDTQIIAVCEKSHTEKQAFGQLDCGRTWLNTQLNRLEREGKIWRRSSMPLCTRRDHEK